MVKQAVNAPKTQDGKTIDLAPEISDGGRRFSLITPAYYPAVMTSMVESVFNGSNGTKKYLKLQPEIALINENRTLINRQDLIVGLWDDVRKQLYHDDPAQSVVWGGVTGALFFLQALGLYTKLPNGQFDLDYEAKLTVDRPIKVQTGIAGYVKGNAALTKLVATAKDFGVEMNKLTFKLSGEKSRVWSMTQLDELVEAFNREHGLSGENTLKTKNVIVGYYMVTKEDVAKHGWYLDVPLTNDKGEVTHKGSNQVFTTKAGFDWYRTALVEGVSAGNSSNKNDW